MDMHALSTSELVKTGVHRHDHRQWGHAHFWQRALSRRQFMGTSVGAAVLGALLNSGVVKPGQAVAHRSHEPVPIPGGFTRGGNLFHVFGPGPNPEVDPNELSTITDFNGFIGVAFLDGEVARTLATGETETFPFLNSDMRFMKGIFRGTDGKVHHGAFAFV
jgi:hypothetical protein